MPAQRLAHVPIVATLIALAAALPASAETKLAIRLDPAATHSASRSLRITSGAAGKLVAQSVAGSKDWSVITAWGDRSLPAAADRERPYDVQVLQAGKVVAEFKLTVDVAAAVRTLDHQPGLLRPLADRERGSIRVTIHFPPAANLAAGEKQRYAAVSGKHCPDPFATVDYSGAYPERQPVLSSELQPARAAVDPRHPVLYTSLEAARCVQIFNRRESAAIEPYRPAVVRRYDDWMTKSFAALGRKTLREIALPGTHDSGAYRLGDRKSPDLSTAEWLAGRQFDIIKPWAKTQRLDIKAQLEGGIRWLDMRTAYDGRDFYFYHALLGPKTRDMLRQIRAFLDEPGHDHELIELEFCNWQGLGNDTPAEVWQRLSKLILGELGEQNVYRRGAPHAARSAAELLKTPLSDILAGHKSRVLVFFEGHADRAAFAFDARRAYAGAYADKHLWPLVAADQSASSRRNVPAGCSYSRGRSRPIKR